MRAAVEKLVPAVSSAVPAHAVLSPHAGWVYSGAIAAETYAQVVIPECVVVLCPNHTGQGAARALAPGGGFAIPGGVVPIHAAAAVAVQSRCGLSVDARAHATEHAIEVHLPLLRHFQPKLQIVPIVLGRLSLSECLRFGDDLARALESIGEPSLVVASTDMSHFLTADVARELDHFALDHVLALDAEGLYREVVTREISMCGFIPSSIAIRCAVARGARAARLVRYANSGDVSGDYSSVVGYAGVVLA
jgi:hypothetical protein